MTPLKNPRRFVGNRYQHFKGGTYIITDVAFHTETNECLIIYADERHIHSWARPLGKFFSSVEVDGTYVRRFTLIEDNNEE